MTEKRNPYISMFVVLIATLVLIFAFDKVMAVLAIFRPLAYAVIIAYLVDGIVRLFMRRCRMKRGLAVASSVVLVLLVCGITGYYTIPFLIDTVGDLVNYVSRLLVEHNTGIYDILESVAGFFNIDIDAIVRFDFTKLDKSILDGLNTAIQGVYGLTVDAVARVGSSLVMVFTSLVIAIYMLIEKEDLLNRGRRFLRAIVSEKNEDYLLDAFTMANDVFKRFIIGKSVDSLIIGILMIIFFMLFGIEYGVVFGIIGGIGNMIPYFGPIISAIPVVLILLIINPWHAVIALAIILVVQQLDSHIIQPKVLSDNIGGISAFWILFAVTICGIAFGLMGMILGVPVVVVVKNLVEDFVDRRLEKRDKKHVKAIEGTSAIKMNEEDSNAKEQ